MNWLYRSNPFDDDRDGYGYQSRAYDLADMRYDYDYNSHAGRSTSLEPQRSTDYEHEYEAAPPTFGTHYSHHIYADEAPSYNRSGDRYERDEGYRSYAEQPSYSRHMMHEETPSYIDGYDSYGGRYDEETEVDLFRKAYDFRRAETTTDVADAEVTAASEEVLVQIRGAMVHLVDDQESPLLAHGNFSIVLFAQAGNGIVAIVKVGETLKWPLTEDEPVVKLDPSHYFFTIRVPRSVDDMDRETAGSHESMSYGVTFTLEGQERELRELDTVLTQYSGFSTPKLVHGESTERDEFDGAFGHGHHGNEVRICRLVQETEVSKLVTESNGAEFWRTIAPNVDDYNSEVAKTMAKGTGNLIKGIFWLRDSTVAQLENGSTYLRGRVAPNSKPSTISPQTLLNVKRARNMTIATEYVANSVLGGMVKAATFFSGALLKSETGRSFLKLLPGEVALVSMDAFARIFDAVEKAGTDVMQSTAAFTEDVVTHRYGRDAGQVTGHTLATAGHAFATAWTVTKVRSAFNPARYRPSRAGLLRAAAQAVAGGGLSK